MIAYIDGEVLERGENWLILAAGGVGYKVFVPADTLFAASVGKRLVLFCHHHFTQDQQALYGFRERRELELFELLLTISGVGPKGALAILSKARPSDIEKAIIRGDSSLFTAVSRVGKKKADHIILELKPKLVGRALDDSQTGGETRKVVAALEGLGYRRDEITEVLRDLPGDLPSDSERIKWALRHLYH